MSHSPDSSLSLSRGSTVMNGNIDHNSNCCNNSKNSNSNGNDNNSNLIDESDRVNSNSNVLDTDILSNLYSTEVDKSLLIDEVKSKPTKLLFASVKSWVILLLVLALGYFIHFVDSFKDFTGLPADELAEAMYGTKGHAKG